MDINKEQIKQLFNKSSLQYLACCLITTAFLGLKFVAPELNSYNKKKTRLHSINQSIENLEKQIEIKRKRKSQEKKIKLAKKVYSPQIKSLSLEDNSVFLVDNLIEQVKLTNNKLTSISFENNDDKKNQQNNHKTNAFMQMDAPTQSNQPSEPVKKLKINTSLEGSYENIKEFIHRIHDFEYLIGISKVDFETSSQDEDLLITEMTFELYIDK